MNNIGLYCLEEHRPYWPCLYTRACYSGVEVPGPGRYKELNRLTIAKGERSFFPSRRVIITTVYSQFPSRKSGKEIKEVIFF